MSLSNELIVSQSNGSSYFYSIILMALGQDHRSITKPYIDVDLEILNWSQQVCNFTEIQQIPQPNEPFHKEILNETPSVPIYVSYKFYLFQHKFDLTLQDSKV